MKYIVLATKYGDKDNKWLTNELAEHLSASGDEVHVLAMSWMSSDDGSCTYYENGVYVYRYKLPKFFYRDHFLVKYIKQVFFPIAAFFYLNKKTREISFDRLITFTPSHLVGYIVRKFKKRNVNTYLVLWDFFPFYLTKPKKNTLFFKVLMYFENWSYKLFDRIGVMTKKNKDFLINNYEDIAREHIDLLPIWADASNSPENISCNIRSKYGIDDSDFVFIYGGAHSAIQELDNIINLAKMYKSHSHVKFIFIGRGNDKSRLQNIVLEQKVTNVRFLEHVPRREYELLLRQCDVGIVSLSRNMNVPSFPSKSLDYMKNRLAILASIDRCTDYGSILENEIQGGVYGYADDIQSLYAASMKLYANKALREKLGENGKVYFTENFSVENVCRIIKRGFECIE